MIIFMGFNMNLPIKTGKLQKANMDDYNNWIKIHCTEKLVQTQQYLQCIA